jgi:mono/diheme cytochrome c family protein
MTRSLASIFLLSALPACGGGSDGPAADPKVVAEAKSVWDTRCTTCHGTAGLGNGPGAAALAKKPRSFKDPIWQQQTQDDKIKKVIVEGGASAGLDAAMAPNPDLASKPEVVAELVKIIRSYK